VIYQRGHFVGGEGVKLFEQSWRPDKTPRAVVVLVHGLKDHSSRYRDLGIHLAYRGLAAYAFDLRGHGYSEGVRDHIDSLDNAVIDLDALVTLVRDRQPGKPIYLLGQGFGASLAAVYAVRKAGPKSPVAGLVLSAPPLRGEVKRSERVGTRAAAIFGPRTHQLEIDLSKWSSDPAVVAAWRTDPLVYEGQPTASTAGEVLRASDEVQKRAGELKLPLLVVFRIGRRGGQCRSRQGAGRTGRFHRQELPAVRGAVPRSVPRAPAQRGDRRRAHLGEQPRRAIRARSGGGAGGRPGRGPGPGGQGRSGDRPDICIGKKPQPAARKRRPSSAHVARRRGLVSDRRGTHVP
jgi:alpha-beta hydrolase superfamily lysophospholipase